MFIQFWLFNFATLYGVDPALLQAICTVESGLKPIAINMQEKHGRISYGTCQVQMRTARYLGFTGTRTELMFPKNSIKYAARYLAYLTRKYEEKDKVISAYNVGHVRYTKAGRFVNQSYVNKVNKELRRLKRGKQERNSKRP